MTEPTTKPLAAANVLANNVTWPTSVIIACSVLTVGITEAVMYLYRAVINPKPLVTHVLVATAVAIITLALLYPTVLRLFWWTRTELGG